MKQKAVKNLKKSFECPSGSQQNYLKVGKKLQVTLSKRG